MYGAFRVLDRRAWEEARSAQQQRQQQPRLSMAAGAGGKASTPAPALLRASSTLAQLHPTEPAPFIWSPVCVRLLLSLWSLLYMSVASAIFSSWSCTSVAQGAGLPPRRFQSAAPDYSCGTREFRWRVAAGAVVFAIFGLGWPTLTFLLSRFHMRQRLQSRQTRSRASMGVGVAGGAAAGAAGGLLAPLRSNASRLDRALYFISSRVLSPAVVSLIVSSASAHLSPSWFSWQLVLPGRKLLLTALVALVPRDSSLLPITVLLLLLALALAQAWVRPYAIPTDNLVESLLLLHLSALFLTAILLSSAQSIDLQLQQQAQQAAQESGLLSGGASSSSASTSFLVTETLTGISIALELVGVLLLVAVLLHYAWLYRSWLRDDEKVRLWMEKKDPDADAGDDDEDDEDDDEEDDSSRGRGKRSGSVSNASTQSASRRGIGVGGVGDGGSTGGPRGAVPAPKLLGTRAQGKGKGGAAPPPAARTAVGQNKAVHMPVPAIASAPSAGPTGAGADSPVGASPSRPFSPSAAKVSFAPPSKSATASATAAAATVPPATDGGSSGRDDAPRTDPSSGNSGSGDGGNVELATIGVRLEPVQNDAATPSAARDSPPGPRAPLSQSILLSHGSGAGGRGGNLRVHFPGAAPAPAQQASSPSPASASAKAAAAHLHPHPSFFSLALSSSAAVASGGSEGALPAAAPSPVLRSPSNSARHTSLAAAQRIESAASFVSRLHSTLQAARSRSPAARSSSAASAAHASRILAASVVTAAPSSSTPAAAAAAAPSAASTSQPMDTSNAAAAATPFSQVHL